MNDFFVGNTVQNGNGLLEDALSGSLVTSFDRLTDALDCGTQGGTQAGVVGALPVSLTGALAGLCAIGHVILSGIN